MTKMESESKEPVRAKRSLVDSVALLPFTLMAWVVTDSFRGYVAIVVAAFISFGAWAYLAERWRT